MSNHLLVKLKGPDIMNKCIFRKKDVKNDTLLCVKQVKQEEYKEWDETMPLPGDIIEGFSENDSDELFVPTRTRSDLKSLIGKFSQAVDRNIWLKVRRGDRIVKLRAGVEIEKSFLNRKLIIKAANDDRHVVVLGDLTLEQCTELQDMSSKVVDVDFSEFTRRRVKYDWKKKVGTYLSDQRSSVISSIIFMPLQNEHNVESTTRRCMAWFGAAISSGVPLIFVNIQTEQIINSASTKKESIQSHNNRLAIRLWYLPGIAELPIQMTPKAEEVRFGMDIKQTEEGFFCVCAVAKDSAADHAGLGLLYEDANKNGYLLILSRLKGKSVMPTGVCSSGLIRCCENDEIKDILASAICEMNSIQLHVMAFPRETRFGNQESVATFNTLQLPKGL